MGSLSQNVNLLEYVRSRSSVDCDCLDIEFASHLGPFVDCTSNQADAFYELQNPARKALLGKSVELAQQWHDEYQEMSLEQLALDIAMIKLCLSMAPYLTGAIHVMANPINQTSTVKLVENGKRMETYSIAELLRRIDPGFDMSNLVIKVVSTWEGLQACKTLESSGIKTIATTLFTFEQAALAAEAGCKYIAPFLHELKAFFDETYKDNEPCFDLCVRTQKYYQAIGTSTRVKVAGLLTSDQAISLAGAQTMTIAPAVLTALSQQEDSEASLTPRSLYGKEGAEKETEHAVTYIHDETMWREAFEKSRDGKGAIKTAQAIEIFSDYQLQGERLIRDYVGAKGV